MNFLCEHVTSIVDHTRSPEMETICKFLKSGDPGAVDDFAGVLNAKVLLLVTQRAHIARDELSPSWAGGGGKERRSDDDAASSRP